MFSQYNLPAINNTIVSVGAVTLFGCYTIASLAIRRVRNSFYAWKNSRSPNFPTVPQEIQNIIINVILESKYEAKWHEALQLSLVCKGWHRFITNHSAWAQNGRQFLGESYLINCSVLPYTIRSYWLEGKNQYHLDGPTVLDPTKSAQYGQYTPWMSHNIIKYPEILFNYLKSVVMVPEWMYFLIVGRVRRRHGFFRNKKNVNRILKMQTALFVFTTAIPFLETLISSTLQATLLPHFMNSPSIWTALRTTPSLGIGTQLRLLAIFFAFLPFDLSSFLPEVYISRIFLILAMFAVNGGLHIFAATSAGALTLKKLTDRKDMLRLPYWMLAFLIGYPFSTLISMVVMGAFFTSMSLDRMMHPTLESFRNAKYWLVFGVVVLGIAMLV